MNVFEILGIHFERVEEEKSVFWNEIIYLKVVISFVEAYLLARRRDHSRCLSDETDLVLES